MAAAVADHHRHRAREKWSPHTWQAVGMVVSGVLVAVIAGLAGVTNLWVLIALVVLVDGAVAFGSLTERGWRR